MGCALLLLVASFFGFLLSLSADAGVLFSLFSPEEVCLDWVGVGGFLVACDFGASLGGIALDLEVDAFDLDVTCGLGELFDVDAS